VKSPEEAREGSATLPQPAAANDKDCENEVRRMLELEDFEPKEAVERFREIGMGGKEA